MAYTLAMTIAAGAANTDATQLVAEFQTGDPASSSLPAISSPPGQLTNGGGTTYFWHLGGGLHLFYTTAVPAGFSGCVRFRYGGASGAYLNVVIPLNPQETENPDTKTSTVPALILLTPANLLNTDGSGRVTPIPLESLVQNSGTAQAGGSLSITLGAGASATDNLYKGAPVKVYSGTGAGQARMITAYNGTTKVATVGRAWATQPDSSSLYAVLALSMPVVDDNLAVTAASVTGNVAGNVIGSVGSVVGAVGSVTGNVGGNVGGSVASVSGDVGGNVTGHVGSVVGAVGSVAGNVTGSVGSVVGAVGSVTAAVVASSVTGNVGGNVSGNVTGSVGSVIGTVGSVTGDIGGNIAGHVASVTGAVGSVTGNVGGSVGSVTAPVTAGTVTGDIGGNLDGNVLGSVVGSTGSVTGAVTLSGAEHTAIAGTDVPAGLTTQGYTAARGPKLDNLTVPVDTRLAAADYTVPPTVAAIADEVWDEPQADHQIPGSMGQTHDPWTAVLPGGYGPTTAGGLLGTLVTRIWTNVTRTLTALGFNVAVSAPGPDDGGVVPLIIGDSYDPTDGRGLDWNITGAPSLAGSPAATATFSTSSGFSKAMTILNAGQTVQTLRLTLTAAETAALLPGNPSYAILIVLSNLHPLTPIQGTLAITPPLP